MKNLQRAGGVSAIVAAATYLFAMGLVVSLLKPMADPTLGFQEYMAFLIANKPLCFSGTCPCTSSTAFALSCSCWHSTND